MTTGCDTEIPDVKFVSHVAVLLCFFNQSFIPARMEGPGRQNQTQETSYYYTETQNELVEWYSILWDHHF